MIVSNRLHLQMNSKCLTIPIVVVNTQNGERHYDIYSKLLAERIILITGEITDQLASLVIAQMLFLESEDSSKDIFVYINSPGGFISSGMSIYDTMQLIKPNVSTLCLGRAASMGAFILAGGAKGKRYALPNSRIMIHQPIGGIQGQASDISIQAKEITVLKDHINNLLAHHTGQNVRKVCLDTDRDYFMSSYEAMAYGIVDQVVTNLNV